MSENNYVKAKAAETVTEAELMAQNTLSNQLDQIRELLWANNCDAVFISTMYDVAYKMRAAGYTVENIIGTILQNVSVGIATGVWGKFSYVLENHPQSQTQTPSLGTEPPTPTEGSAGARVCRARAEEQEEPPKQAAETMSFDFLGMLPEDLRKEISNLMTKTYYVERGLQYAVNNETTGEVFSTDKLETVTEQFTKLKNQEARFQLLACDGYWVHEAADSYDSEKKPDTICFGPTYQIVMERAAVDLSYQLLEVLKKYIQNSPYNVGF